MKLGYGDIQGFLAAPPAKAQAVLVYGPDGGLVRERAGMLCKAWNIDPADPFTVIELGEATLLEDPARLSDELNAMSLLGGRRLVSLRDATDKCTAILTEALATAQGDNLLLVTSDELPSKSSLRLAFEKLGNAAALPCYRDEGKNLEGTIREALQGYGLQCDLDTLRYLAAHLGNDRGVTRSELEKISLYMLGETRLTLEIAMQLVGQNDDLSTDDLSHAVADGDLAALDDTLARLLSEGAQPVQLLRGLSRHFQKLGALAASVQAGKSADQAIEAYRPQVFFRDKPLLKRQLGRWNATRARVAQARLMEAEREVKSGAMMPELVMSHALFSLAAG